jgi:probable selenium-dependent hydroxylase accessory protein YqeC
MNGLGRAAGETVVHRLPEFLALTGLREGDAITTQALRAMACAPGGMFKNSAGQKYLLVNQVEDDTAARTALSFLQIIKENYPNRFAKLLFGSVHQDAWQEV